MALFYDWLGEKRTRSIRLAVMDMWKPFHNVTAARAPQAAILYDKFHVMRHLGDALDEVRKSEYRKLSGQDRSYIKGQKYTLLSRRENLTLKGRQALKKVLMANKRLNTAYLLRESFGQLWDYEREGWARRFFENWRASLKWQRLKPYEKFAEMIDRHWDGIRRLLQAREQGLPRIRGRTEQQDPRHPASSIRTATTKSTCDSNSHLHAAASSIAVQGFQQLPPAYSPPGLLEKHTASYHKWAHERGTIVTG